MRRKISILLIAFASVFPAFAEEVFFSSIVNASYLTDFALNMFPVSFWGEFGIDHLDIFEDLNTKAVVRVEAGMAQRTVRQNPSDGSILDYETGKQRQYTVVFSDGKAGFSQGIIDNPAEGKPDFLTFSAFLGMRWEQAFPSLHDVQSGNYEGFFNDPFYFPSGSESVGLPELRGNKYSLTNSLSISFDFNNLENHYLIPEGYNFSFDLVFAPWWLLNTDEILKSVVNTGSTIDYYKILYTANYKHTFIQQLQEDSDFNLFSIYMDFNFRCQLLFGKAVPQHAMTTGFRNKTIPPRPFITDVQFRLTVTGPEFFTIGTYPSVTLYIENSLAAGRLLNSIDETSAVKFYGTIGIRADLYIMGMFRAYAAVYYDYLAPEWSEHGFDYEVGAYFTASF